MKLILTFGLALTVVMPLRAFAVHDPINLAQNSAHYLKELMHFESQVRDMERNYERIKYEISAAKRMADKLKKFNITSIRTITQQINNLRHRTRSIGYTYESVAQQFESFYQKDGKFSQKYKDWQKQSDDSIKDAMVSQGLLEKSEKHMADLDKILEEKRIAKGNADTLQALGEINAIQSRQLADLSQIVATDARAKQSVIMEERAKETQKKDTEARLMRDFSVHKKSRPLMRLPSLGQAASAY